jgi:uncharacterized membrane protein YbhN (UPF0104 family)
VYVVTRALHHRQVGRLGALAAIVVLVREFASINLHEVLAGLTALPKRQIFVASALTAASYLLLTGYDFLALFYVRRQLRLRDILFASFTAFAFSNNIGFQLLSGGSIRYRIYSGLGINPVEIGEIVAFCTFTYALGVITVGGLVALFEPVEVASALHLPESFMPIAGSALLSFDVGYLAIVARWRRPVSLGRYRLRPPPLILAWAQVVLASIDAMLASAVIYVLLPGDLDVTYESFLGIYVVAATAGVLSLVPGGLGVFEAVVTVMTAPPSKILVLDAFLAYRIIYFLFPLAIAIVWFALHELRRRHVM